MLFIAAILAAATQASPTSTACPGYSTPEVNRCLGNDLARVEAEWHRYAAAAMARVARDHRLDAAESMRVTNAFKQAEAAWTNYRAAECAAVFDDWSAGTIRTSMEEMCETRLTVLHVHAIWRDWLTYLDSSPPILPEPNIEEGLGRRLYRDTTPLARR